MAKFSCFGWFLERREDNSVVNYEATTLLKDDQQILHRLMLLRCAVDIGVSGHHVQKSGLKSVVRIVTR